MMVEAFICQVAGQGGTEQTVVDDPPSFPQVCPGGGVLAATKTSEVATARMRCNMDNVSTGLLLFCCWLALVNLLVRGARSCVSCGRRRGGRSDGTVTVTCDLARGRELQQAGHP